LKHNILNKILK